MPTSGYRWDIWDMSADEQLRVFQIFIPEASLTRRFKNSLRGDRNGDCSLKLYNGKLKLMDQGGRDYHGLDMVQLWIKERNVSFREAVLEIKNQHVPVVSKTVIEDEWLPGYFEERDWDDRDTEFWAQYKLDKEDLKFSNLRLLPVRRISVYSNKLKAYLSYYDKDSLMYVYDWGDGVIKGYRPGMKPKFVASVKHDYFIIEGNDTVFIGSGGKDLAAVHKVTGWTCIANQGENQLFTLPDQYKGRKLIISFDGDETGLDYTYKVAEKLTKQGEQADFFLCPAQGLIKDYADWAKELSPIAFKELLYSKYERRNTYSAKDNCFVQI